MPIENPNQDKPIEDDVRLGPGSDDSIRELIKGIANEAHSEIVLTTPELGIIASMKSSKSDDNDEQWLEEPITLARFVNDPYHMGQPRLSMRQQGAIDKFLGVDPKRIFTDPEVSYRISVLLWGKGSGKDWICTLIQCYIVYLLLIMKNPRQVITLAPEEPIDILNVAYSADQASRVYFTKFLNRVYSWPWLSQRYLIMESGKIINKKQHPGKKPSRKEKNFVRIGQDMVDFPDSIRAISEHSESESYEGYNILFWVMDEAAAFHDRGKKANARKVFSTLRTSAHSRFPSLWRGMLISYPRSADDFMMTMYHTAIKEMALEDPIMYADKGSTWEINPTKHIAQFVGERRIDPVDYECKYKCNPPPQEGAIFDPDAIDALLTLNRAPLFDVESSIVPVKLTDPSNGRIIRQNRIGKVVSNIRIHDLTHKQIPRVFHVDAGLTSCPAALIVAHGEPCIVSLPNHAGIEEEHIVNKVVVDQCVVWMPNKEKKLNVSINNIAAVIQELAKHCNVVRGSYDQWNSESSIEALMASGIPVERHDIDADDYGRMETLINLGAIEIPQSDVVEWEMLLNLGLKKVVLESESVRRKYVCGEGGYKDPVDCLAGVCRLLNDPEIRGLVAGVAAPRILAGVPLMPSASLPAGVDHPLPSSLPDKMVTTHGEHQGGTPIQRHITHTHNVGVAHRLLAEIGKDGTKSLAYKSPGNLGKVRAPKCIIGK